ncbi:hypothetical protein WHX56_14080 [Achromobacter veterisilvae]|uniref:Uncharacterized protein n=1 Tax=Achromobacter veterisilvae TaxID=2069367 RepID=A0ABZ2S6G7_9BURK
MKESIRDWFDWRGWVVVGSAIAIVLALAAILSPAFRTFFADSATAAWASAVGTAAAAAAAVWLGLREGNWRHQKNSVDEAIFTALIRPEAEALIKQLQVARQLHDAVRAMGFNRASSILALESARTYGSRPALVETRKYVEQFGALGERRAAALARAVGTLGLLGEALQMAAHYRGEGDTHLAQSGLDESLRLIERIQISLCIALQIDDEEYQHIIRPPVQGIMEPSERYKSLQESLNKKIAAGEIQQ